MDLRHSLAYPLAGCILFFSVSVALAAEEPPVRGERTLIVEATATVISVNRITRKIVVRTPDGDEIPLRVDDAVPRFDEIRKGDVINATYRADILAELRQPTPEERAEPWLELNAAQKADLDLPPGATATRVVRAVCDIVAVNYKLHSITVRDTRNRLRIIENVRPENLARVSVGDEVVFTFIGAVAMDLTPTGR